MKHFILIVSFGFAIFFAQSQTKPVVPAKTSPAAKSVIPAKTTKSAATTKSTPATPARIILKNKLDSFSYAIGILDGTFFKSQGVTAVNGQALGEAFSDIINGKTIMSADIANTIVRSELQIQARARILPNIKECESFLDQNRKKQGIKETPTGLQYEVIRMGDGPKPLDTNTVKVHYEGFLLNGKKFDSSRDRGEPIEFQLNNVIRGWTEGVQLMPVGSVFKFYIPYQLGYGEQGAGESIPGGSLLIFEVELLGFH